MKFIPRPDLPSPIVNALIDDTYSENVRDHIENIPDAIRRKAKHHLSVTTQTKSPRQRILFLRHHDKLEVDPIEYMWRLFGKGIHKTLEDFCEAGDLIEVREGMLIDGVYVHGQADRYAPRDGVLQDYKITSAESALYDAKVDYEFQLNALAFILGRKIGKVKRLELVFIYRNWRPRNIKEGSNYPLEPIKVVEIPMWPKEKTLAEIKRRIKAHVEAEELEDDELPHCTDQERWMTQDEYKVFKLNADGSKQKIAKFRSVSKIESQDFLDQTMEADKSNALLENASKKKPKPEEEVINSLPKYVIDKIPGRPVKCGFCEVRHFCSQYLAEVENNQIEEDNE